MIEFLSIFFGLMTGTQTVELAVSPPVAVVGLVLDGRSVGKIQGPPWLARIDLGPKLVPHELTARAIDAGGHEIAQAREWVNLPQPLAKLDVLLEGDPRDPRRTVKISWKNLRGDAPRSVSLTFDGRPLPLDASGRAALPSHDLESVHLLSATVSFSAGYELRKDVAIGGALGSEVSTELTGLAVHLRTDSLPPPSKLAGWFTTAGVPLTVAAVEAGPA